MIGRPVVKEEKEFFGRRSKAIDKLSIEFKKILETIGIPIWCFQTKNWVRDFICILVYTRHRQRNTKGSHIF